MQFIDRLGVALELARRSGAELSVLAIELERRLRLRILLPATGAPEAHRLAEEFRQGFVEACVGTATYPEDGLDCADLIRFADWAVDCDKRARQPQSRTTVRTTVYSQVR